MDATIEVHLTSIDLLLSVKVDSRNRINSVSTIHTLGKMKINDMTNPQELKSNTPSEEEPSVLTESTEKCSSWFEKVYSSFLTAAESFLKWLYIGIEWPRDINQGMFALRTVTRFDQYEVNDFANRSLISLEMDLASKEDEYSSGFVRKSPNKNVLPVNHTGNEADCVSQDLITSGNYTGNEANYVSLDLVADGTHTGNEANCISSDLIGNGNSAGNEANCISSDLIANGNHNGNEANYESLDLIAIGNPTGNEANCISLDLIADGNSTGNEANCISSDLISNGNYTGNEVNYVSLDLIAIGNQTGNEANWMLPELITGEDHIRNKDKDEKAGNESIKGHQSMVVFLRQFKEWPALRTEFLPVDCYDGWNSQMLSALPLINPNDDLYDDTVGCYNASSGIGENRIGNGDHMPVIPTNPLLNESLESFGKTILNYSFIQDEAMCPKDLLDAGYWIQSDGFDCNEDLTLAFEDPLKDGTVAKDVAVKIRKGEIAVNKSVMCPVRSNKRDHYFEITPPKSEEFCRKKVTKHADDSSWNFAKLLDHCNEYLNWRRSSDVSLRTESLLIAMEICMAGSNKTGPETKFCALKDTKGTSDSLLRMTKWWNNCWPYLEWRKSNVSVQTDPQDNVMAKVPINESLFCPLNPSQRSSESAPGLTMNIYHKIVDIKRWITSNEILLKACNFTSYYWASFETILISWTWQNTFDVMIAFWITDYCFMALYVTTAFIKEIMRRRPDARPLERELEEAKEEEELQSKLVEEERAQASGSQSCQSKPAQGSGHPRKTKEEEELQRKLVEEERAQASGSQSKPSIFIINRKHVH
ncbi:uncharacterized protein LOC122949411 [Acropora millepora]|uniref:uncharacterized protein LOC122949411 n=1 Tax=Acropora millepora TaxID=45264 RepID=UPI001CF24453|nr:uncharacterized protein LOC122949411 [Acropora millepora]